MIQTKPTQVKAFQWHGEEPNDCWPGWLWEAHLENQKRRRTDKEGWPKVTVDICSQNLPSVKLSILQPDDRGLLWAKPGDFIVLEKSGQISVHEPYWFHKMYDAPVEAAKRPDTECPKCGGLATSGGAFGTSGVRNGVPYNESEGISFTCGNGHKWEKSKEGHVTVVPPSPPSEPYVRTPIPVFDEWSRLNQIMCDSRSRFDVLREELPKCKTKAEVKSWIDREGFGERYPILPESLPD